MINILVITSESFPYGGAATNRMLTYLPRLAKMGYPVNMISFSNNCRSSKGSRIQHEFYADVSYSSISLQFSNKFVRSFFRCYSDIILGVYALLDAKRTKPKIVLAVTNDLFLFIVGFLAAKICDAKYLLEKSEYPFTLLRAKNRFQKSLASLNIRIFYKCFDGLLVMTNTLAEYLASVCRRNVAIHLMPMTVDFNRFKYDFQEMNNWIAYIGSFGFDKDGVHHLIKAFRIVHTKHPSWSLLLIGDLPEKEALVIQSLIDRYAIKECVILAGRIGFDEVPAYLSKSRVLVLARPDTLQAHFGFPSKLGEYLATGNPVVVTDVGEISQYLHDGDSAMIVRPGDHVGFADKINFLIENPNEAHRIGINGKKVAQKNFDAEKNTAGLAKYLQSLVNSI